MRGMHPERKGMTRVMNCGRTATIETYRNSCDMDIRYEDGTLKTGVRYDKFLKGEVKYPVKRTYPSYKSDKVNLYLHEKRVMNNGIMAEVITFRHRNDIDVKFANGVIKEHLSYENFHSGRITDGNINRLGETRIMKNGLKATIVRYGSCIDIDVLFENGVLRRGRVYHSFVLGSIGLGCCSQRETIERYPFSDVPVLSIKQNSKKANNMCQSNTYSYTGMNSYTGRSYSVNRIVG